ncbi:CDP-diacylglycerol--glycerol-3-phosphate 3-phosphatidyltransferase [Hypocenomyce scalaris]|nr:CDP-diacylglycerol--glycerol-3-phosphate 3-phosphatidyltransferase [Hypocenomyce scalaris]
MLVRRITTCPLRTCAKRYLPWRPGQRRYSTSVPGASEQHATNASILGGVTAELDRIAPRFEIRAEQIQVLEGPSEFYETLKSKIRGAKRRVYLSTLYIGKTEHELVSTIRTALQSNQELKVSFLTDALRGTRETPDASCASLLCPLMMEFPERVEVRMFHTPNLTGLRKKLIPRRINEGWGLQHMKLYGVDDEIILSGANLSSDYFTNRQDRYHVFSSKRVTDYFALIHHAVCSVSFRLTPGEAPDTYTLDWPSSNSAPSPLEQPRAYIEATTALLSPLIRPSPTSQILPPSSRTSTLVYPLASFTPLLSSSSPSTELPALTTLLNHVSSPNHPPIRYLFTAGYFNPHPTITALLLRGASSPSTPGKSSAINTVLTASPQANGFFGSKGVSGMLPAAYSLLSRRFLEAAQKAGAGNSVEVREWRRGTVGVADGWTYHAKGLWVTLPGAAEPGPSITLVGSSNYTQRSYTLDLETNALIITGDETLMRRLADEEKWLLKYSRRVDLEEFRRTERRVGWHVRVAMWVVRVLGGAL